jgi:hypothetical protein
MNNMLLDALSYPIRKSGWIMILIGAIFSAILDLLQFAPVFGIAIALFSAGYFGAFYLDIISTTMTDHDEVPDWPSFSSFIDDIISPFIRLVGLVLISFLPAFALPFANQNAPWFIPAIIAAVVYGCFYFPMAVLATQAFGGLGASLPHIVFPAVFRALPGYLLTVAALVVGFVVCGVAQAFAEDIPYVGWFFTAAVALYSLMFQARLIGLIYRTKSEKLGWE